MSNPPYAAKSQEANIQNEKYELLDSRITETYVKETIATSVNTVYDPYIKAFRWASDRLDPINGGIIGFVSNGNWLDNNSFDGFRKCLEKEFSSIYVFNLRGNQRTSGEISRKEGGKIFGSGSRTPISITILVKNPKVKRDKAEIRYRDIGDYLTREQKLEIVKESKSVLSPDFPTEIITPNEHGDWLNQRNDAFSHFIPLNCEKKFLSTSSSFFSTYSLGLATGRDVWVSGYSKEKVIFNTNAMIDFYNQQVDRYNKLQEKSKNIDDDIDLNPKKISWNRNLKDDFKKNKKHFFEKECMTLETYRPFSIRNIYFNKDLNAMMYQNIKIFPKENICICVPGISGNKNYSVFISNKLSDLNLMSAGTQCFPLYWYEKVEHIQRGFFDTQDSDYVRHNGITDFILDQARQIDYTITKEDIFYYVYGFLHCPEYRETFAADLKKMLPRIPLIDNPADFRAFSKAGRDLAALHLNYETVAPCPDVIVEGAELGNFRVEKMRFRSKDDKSTIVFNPYITVSNIPLKAYDYVINGQSAVEWIMDQYQIQIDEKSGITNDPNDWGLEHNNPRYILDLLLSVINVSLQSLDIIAALPKVDFTEKKTE